MKTRMLVVVLALLAVPADRAEAEVSFGIFYSSLAPHGEWIAVDAGVYAWRPIGVAAGWRPYYNGQWLWTDDGWYWDSAEPWAWAVYHYGRWYYDDYYGWLWTPGYEWAPAWVEWRVGGPYVGWAPLAPYAVFSISFGIYYTHRWVTPYDYWCFVPVHAVCYPSVHRYVYRHAENTRIIGRTRSAGSIRSEGGRIRTRGPDRSYIERRGQTHVPAAEVREVDDPRRAGVSRGGDGDRIQVYRPQLRGGDAPERPADVRQAERPVTLDTRRIDARARSEGRDLERSLQRRQLDREALSRRLQQARPRPESERRYETRIERGTRQPQFESPVPRRLERDPERPATGRSGSVTPERSSRTPSSVTRPSSPSVRSSTPQRSRTPSSPPPRSGRRE